MPVINARTVAKLSELYQERERLQKRREQAAKPGFWVDALRRSLECNPLHELTTNLGGDDQFTELIKQSVDSALEAKMKGLDASIRSLGGEP